MLAAIAGLGLGVLAIYVDVASWDEPTRKFARSGAFVFWVALLSLQTMVWTLALPLLVATFRRHWRQRAPGSAHREVVPSAVVLALLVGALVVVPRVTGKLPSFIPYHHLKIDTLTGLALVVGLIAAMSMWLIRGRAEALAEKDSFVKADVEKYLTLRTDLEWLLVFLGGVIGLAVLSSAALRHLALIYDQTIDFPAESVVLYGLVLSLLVALTYVPTFTTLHGVGQRIRDSAAPLPGPEDTEIDRKVAKRKTLDELLGLKVSASASFRAGVAILSPLLGALTSLLPRLGG
jgi:hypothetical protein